MACLTPKAPGCAKNTGTKQQRERELLKSLGLARVQPKWVQPDFAGF